MVKLDQRELLTLLIGVFPFTTHPYYLITLKRVICSKLTIETQ